MNSDMERVFSDFKLIEKVPKEIIEQYKEIVGEDVVEIWERYGFGSTFNGYLKVINPNDLIELIEETYNKISEEIPIFVTGMGDIILCDSEGTFNILDYRHQRCAVVWTNFEIEWDYFFEEYCLKNDFSWMPYLDAVKKYGEPGYSECFGYEPLLSLGGSENVDNLNKVNYIVHIDIMSQFQGMLSF